MIRTKSVGLRAGGATSGLAASLDQFLSRLGP